MADNLKMPPPADLDGFGRDLAAEETAFRTQLQRSGIDIVRLWYQRVDGKSDPMKFQWMERWLAEQDANSRLREQVRANREQH